MSGLARRLLGRLTTPSQSTAAPMDREEKGYPPTESIRGDNRTNTIMSVDPSELIPSQDRLLVFRTLTGIDTVPAINRGGYSTRSAANIGIYTRVIREERRSKKSYRFISAGIHICLGLQIVIGAAITAVAASNGSHRAITGLGAINTIFAGALAYVKGSGYPESLKHHELEWKKIREYIEQRERELCLANPVMDVYHEVRIIEQMYHTTKKELKLGRAVKDYKEDTRSDRDRATDDTTRRRSNDLRPVEPSTAPTSTVTPAPQKPEHAPETSGGISGPNKPRDN